MSKVIKFGEEGKNLQRALDVFIDYFRITGVTLSNQEQLFDGRAIIGFLKLISDMSPWVESQGLDEENQSSRIVLFKKILSIIENFSNNVLKTNYSKIDVNLYEICMQQKESQLVKLLIFIFKLAVQANNKSFFIETVMQMNSKSQFILAEFLKNDCQFFKQQSPIRQECQHIETKGRESRVFENNIELVDKIYEYEQENEKLTNLIDKLQIENDSLRESIQSLQKSFNISKEQNQKFKLLIIDYEEAIMRMKDKESDRSIETFQDRQNLQELNQIMKQYSERNEILKVQQEGINKKYEQKISDLNDAWKGQKEKNKVLSRSHEIVKDQLQQLINRCNKIDEEMQDQNQFVKSLQQKNQELEDRTATLKFELNYKDSQIDEFKEVMMNCSNFGNSQEENQYRKPMLLADFNVPQIFQKKILKVETDELKNLRLKVKQLKSQNNNLKYLKAQNKELGYQKKKLIKILREYEGSRGEENQILNGCLYELRIKYKQSRNLQKQDSTNDGKSPY